MKTRTIIVAVATLGIVLGSGVSAFAWQHGGGHNGGGYGHNGGMGYNGGGMGYNGNCPYYGSNGAALTPEKQTAIDSILKESDTRLQPLMDQYNAKRIELDALNGNPNVKPETISKLAGEIAALQGQIRKEMTTRNDKIVSEGGMARGNGNGYGMGRGGHRGGHRGGSNCW